MNFGVTEIKLGLRGKDRLSRYAFCIRMSFPIWRQIGRVEAGGIEPQGSDRRPTWAPLPTAPTRGAAPGAHGRGPQSVPLRDVPLRLGSLRRGCESAPQPRRFSSESRGAHRPRWPFTNGFR